MSKHIVTINWKPKISKKLYNIICSSLVGEKEIGENENIEIGGCYLIAQDGIIWNYYIAKVIRFTDDVPTKVVCEYLNLNTGEKGEGLFSRYTVHDKISKKQIGRAKAHIIAETRDLFNKLK